MQIVINLPKDVYEDIIAHDRENREGAKSAYYFEGLIQNGTPLPKGHGDLIDRDKVSSKLVSLIRKFYKMFPTERLHSNVDRAKINEVQHLIRTLSEEEAIIKADTAESEG